MKAVQETLHIGFTPDEYCRIPHMICLADFDTSHPNPNRIDRIAKEIDEYLKYKNKNVKSVR